MLLVLWDLLVLGVYFYVLAILVLKVYNWFRFNFVLYGLFSVFVLLLGRCFIVGFGWALCLLGVEGSFGFKFCYVLIVLEFELECIIEFGLGG